MNKNTVAVWMLRIGLSFVFFYASVEIFLNPANFLKYVPLFMQGVIPMNIFLPVFGVAEVALAIWLLAGWKGQMASLISALLMVGIVAFNMEYFNILFRNVAIGFGSVALILLEGQEETASKEEKTDLQMKKAA